MTNLIPFSKDLAQSLTDSSNQFPVDFDEAWQWIGYAKKQNAKSKLTRNFELNIDYTLTQVRESLDTGGSYQYEQIKITVACFKDLGMMAGTEKGKQIRAYFRECERTVKEVIPQSAPARSLPPIRDSIDYIHASTLLENMPQGRLQQLLKDKLVHEISLQSVNEQRALTAVAEPVKQYTTATVRASELGYSTSQIGNGSSLGKYIKAAIESAFSDRQGQYTVKHYEINDTLDTRIHAYFLTRAL